MKIIIILVFTLFYSFNNLEARQFWILFDSTNSMMEVNRVNKVLVDREDNVWFTTNGYGLMNEYKVNLYKYKNGQFTVYNPYKSLKGYVNIIDEIMIDRFGNPWLASTNFGIAKFEDNNWRQLLIDTNDLHASVNIIYQLVNDNENNIWVGSFNGLYKLDLNMNLISPIYKYPLKRNWAMTVLSMVFNKKKNELWFSAVDEALFKTTSGSDYYRFDYDSVPGLKGKSLDRLVLDSLNNIWFCAFGYLHEPTFGYFNGNEFKLIDSTVTGLKSNYIEPLGTDRYNNVWLSCSSGLVRYDGKTWQLFDTTNTDLPTNTFSSISFDSFNNIWLGTDKGLLVINFGEDGVVLDVDEHKKQAHLSVTPNPATDYIEIPLESHTLNGEVENVKIYDVLGIEQHVSFAATPLSEGNLRLDVSSLPAGVYFVRVGGQVLKFVKL